jgi:hypothetical protein
VRAPRTYIPNNTGIDQTVQELYFYNENRPDDRHPTEGFSDTFATFMRYGEERLLQVLVNNPRVEFFQNNMCRWLRQLFNSSS